MIVRTTGLKYKRPTGNFFHQPVFLSHALKYGPENTVGKMNSGWFIAMSGCLAITSLTALAEAPGGKDAPEQAADRQATLIAQAAPDEKLAPLAVADRQSQAPRLRVGDRLDNAAIHTVTRPGLYGMGKVPAGSAYGIVDGNLVRYNPETMQLESVIRSVDAILD